MNLKAFLRSAIAIAAVLCITFTATAQKSTHTVKRGETLFSIAKKYNVSVKKLQQWNDLQQNGLSVGQTLAIKQGSAASQDSLIHTVEPQETLFSISKRYNVSIAELKTWNDLSTNNLEVGQKLTVYPSEKTEQRQQSIVTDTETQQNTYYAVKSGDSLYKIAKKHDMTVDELKSLNDLSSNTIRVGQKLTVRGSSSAPPSVAESTQSSPQGKFIVHKVSGGSTSLDEILDKFQMEEQEFRALNPDINSSRFQPGQKLTLLAPPSKTYRNPYLNNSKMQDLGTTYVTKYSNSERAKPTTSGELYNPNALTAAHSNISLGSVIFVENPKNKKGTYVLVNDRSSDGGLKLSSAAWQALDFNSGKPMVTIYQNQ